MPCDWLDFGHFDLGRERTRTVAACRLQGSTSVQLFTPDGWEYEQSLSSQHVFSDSTKLPEFLEPVRREKNGVEVYRDLRTGKEVYQGRPFD